MVAQVTRRESRQFQIGSRAALRGAGRAGLLARRGAVPPRLDTSLGPPKRARADVRVHGNTSPKRCPASARPRCPRGDGTNERRQLPLDAIDAPHKAAAPSTVARTKLRSPKHHA